jgi:putative DNA methylase
VKSAICTSPLCKKEVPLYTDYIVSQKKPSIRFWRDVKCPRQQCGQTFDWEREPTTLIGELHLTVNEGRTSAGELRGNVRWAYSNGDTVECPWCEHKINPILTANKTPARKRKLKRKKVLLTALLCPHCESVWQWRGDLPEDVTCKVCQKSYGVFSGNVTEKGKFVCSCGNKDAIIESLRRLPEDQLLPAKPYAMQGYCSNCGSDEEIDDKEEKEPLLNGYQSEVGQKQMPIQKHDCKLTKTRGKFYKRVSPADLAQFINANEIWERVKMDMSYPKQEVPEGYNTNQMRKHNYRFWYHMFNARQLLCLSTLLEAIDREENQKLKEMLLIAFSNTLEANNVFTRFITRRTTPGGTAPAGLFARHDYQPKATYCEQNVWGVVSGNNTFSNRKQMVLGALEHAIAPWDNKWNPETNWVTRVPTEERFNRPDSATLFCEDSRLIDDIKVDAVITDPPYAGNVNYSELSDFFYVWLRLVLAKTYKVFTPEITPKLDEIVENATRGKTAQDFEEGLAQVFQRCYNLLKEDGALVFTFHHSEGSAWESLLRAVCGAGFEIDSIYPIHGEREASLHLLDKESAISYDLVHVCKKRSQNAAIESRSWAGIRHETRRLAREEIRAIEAGRYGKEPLTPADVNIVLIGKCLELYSRHYGSVVGHDDKPVELHEALKEIRSMVDELVSKEHPLPSELEDIDAESRLYLLTLCGHKEIKSDDVNKATRGILEISDLMRAGLIIKGRAERGRKYKVKQPEERYQDLRKMFQQDEQPQEKLFEDTLVPKDSQVIFINYVHFLMGLAGAGEDMRPWVESFRGMTPQIRAACEFLQQRNPNFAPMTQKVLGFIDPGSLFRAQAES